MEKGRAKPHLQRAVESVKVSEFEMDFCYLLRDPKRRHQHGDQAWATTIVMVDVAAPYAASNENTRCKGSSGKRIGKTRENSSMAADES